MATAAKPFPNFRSKMIEYFPIFTLFRKAGRPHMANRSMVRPPKRKKRNQTNKTVGKGSLKMKSPLIAVLFALASCTSMPHITRIEAQNNWLVLNLATESNPDCGSIGIGTERITYTIACKRGGKANLARRSVRLDWQAGELSATGAGSSEPLFRIRCSRAQFEQINAWQAAAQTASETHLHL